MNIKFFVLIILSVYEFLPNICFGQYDINNLKKYWFYRKRIVDYFTAIWPATGESHVADRRNELYNWETSAGSQRITFGDHTTNLGDYIGMLATEFKLLFRTMR